MALGNSVLRMPSGDHLNEQPSLITTLLDRTDALLERWYARVGLWPSSLIIAIALVLVAFIYVDGGTVPVSHGEGYAALSRDPFAQSVSNPFRFRILAPLIGWVLHLRGPLFILVPWFFLVGFVAMVNVWSRREGAWPSLALVIMLAMIFSPVIMHSLVAPGYIEVVSYFLLGMALMNVRSMLVSCACMALAVMTHESAIFLTPAWLLAAMSISGKSRRWWAKRLLLLAGMLLPYLAYRFWVVQVDEEALSAAYYFSYANLRSCVASGPLGTVVGIFAVFRLHWLVLAIPFFMLGLRNGNVRWALLLVASVGLTLVIAFDTTRMFCWTFPLLVLGSVELGKCVGRKMAVALLMVAWILNFLIPPYTTTGAESYRLKGIRNYVTQ
ncbi:MAG: hypothetical protein IPH05_02315 [Flavobacteriales bacterium]|nr:hypothetical protein [Flavobacteriales bacterium]MBK6550055.1 hypothetical protein [Flavobacteriales bacterium]MBK6881781.1 hypothetical protein [Flavobacteriales bacterium]MBK7102566.1 hypothetical protein [Flavobacteriales bacterium]MBK7113299.1 hypothetical protein [Flavobacteriales bacterium]